MGSFVRIITSRLAGPLLGSVALLALVGNGYQWVSNHFEVAGLNKQVTHLSSENANLILHNAVLEGNQATLEATISTQNAAVDGMKSAADLLAAQSKANQANFNTLASVLDSQAAQMNKLPPLPPGVNNCVAASQLIRDSLAGEHSK